MRHDVSRELRNPHGEWTTGGGAESALRAVAGGSQRTQVPTNFVHPSTGALMGHSETGDTFEHLLRTRGADLIEAKFGHPYIMIAGKGTVAGLGRTSRTTPLDFKLDEHYGGELKTLNSNSLRKKTAIKKVAQARKQKAVQEAGLKPLLIVQVVDMQTRTVNVYSHPAFSSKTVTQMDHLGSYTFSARDFRNAQIQTGHWQQRQVRADASGPAPRA